MADLIEQERNIVRLDDWRKAWRIQDDERVRSIRDQIFGLLDRNNVSYHLGAVICRMTTFFLCLLTAEEPIDPHAVALELSEWFARLAARLPH
jgi:hypothetical protein